jgi:hypothetical protein
MDLLAFYKRGPMGSSISFQLVHKKMGKEGKVKIGTYGFIKGAQYFIAGEVKKGPFSEVDYGFLFEKIMLHILELGLGSCWLGGTFKRSEFTQFLGNTGDMIIPAISPVGFPANGMSKREKLIRRGAGSDSRKAWEELFFEEKFGNVMDERKEDAYLLPLQMLRLAPSASNKQPWRIVRSKKDFHFFLQRTPGYGGFIKNVDLQRIDIGIAMAHFELSCNETGRAGSWKILKPGIELADDCEYIVSWVPGAS